MTKPAELLISIDASPAWATGHFPGDPMLPGAKLIDIIVSALLKAGVLQSPVCQIVQSKFTAAVRPGDTIKLSWVSTGSRLRYTCEVGATSVASGQISRAQ